MKTKKELEREIGGRKIVFEKTFEVDHDAEGVKTFSAYYKAQEWLKKQGFHEGSMERFNPIGLVHETSIENWEVIPKWTNMAGYEREHLDGVMVSERFRESAVTVYLTFNPED